MDKRNANKKGRLRYLSNRIILWLSALYLFLLGVIFVFAIRPDIITDGRFSGVIIILVLLIFVLVMHFFIIRQFFNKEYQIKRILDGYLALEDPDSSKGLSLSPVTEAAEQAIYRTLNSNQAVNLNRRQAQYLALQNQINPHFLYNTLDGIRSETLIAGLDNVAEMTEALAIFFRYTISNDENLVTIEDEIDNCRTYFKIQQYRFGERISLKINLEDEELGAYMIPKLTLQPILENSIIHGTEMKIGNGTTTIDIKKEDDIIVIEVGDDGVGMDEDALERLNRRLDSGVSETHNNKKPVGGIALNNVNNRIHLIFGPEYGVHVFSLKDIGTTVEITIPAVTDVPEIAGGDRNV